MEKHVDSLKLLQSFQQMKEMKDQLETALAERIEELEQRIGKFHAGVREEIDKLHEYNSVLTSDMGVRLGLLLQKVADVETKTRTPTKPLTKSQEQVLGGLVCDSFRTTDEVTAVTKLDRNQVYQALRFLQIHHPKMIEARVKMNARGKPMEYRQRGKKRLKNLL